MIKFYGAFTARWAVTPGEFCHNFIQTLPIIDEPDPIDSPAPNYRRASCIKPHSPGRLTGTEGTNMGLGL